MNIISNDGSNKLNRSRKARVSYKVQRTINASLNAATSTRAVSSNPNFVTRQKIEIIFGQIQNGRSLNELNRGQSGLETYGLFSNLTYDFYLLVVEQHRTQIVIHALLKCQQENLYHEQNVTHI